jgi:hypothetical protein
MESFLQIIPKLPAKNLKETQVYFERKLGFSTINTYQDYLLMSRGTSELHFFSFPDLDPLTNYAMIYIRVSENIERLYQEFQNSGATIHPNGKLETKPWGTREFAILDPNHTLLTFGQLI